MRTIQLATALTALLLLSCAANAAPASKREVLDAKIDSFVTAHTKNAADAQRVIDVLGDTVLEGDSCDRLYRGELTKRCKADLLDQIAIELN